ncbi:hypothetical protein BH11MYX1_BH11MYX1_08030 [soil metagenome]
MTNVLRFTTFAFATTAVALLGAAALATPTGTPPAAAPKMPPPPAVMPPPPAPTGPVCYELSATGKEWGKTPELLCVATTDKAATLTFKTGMPPAPTEVAVFHLDLTARVRCIDCNKDVFSLANPSNSVLNALQVSFNGKRDVKAGTEIGTVAVGKTTFHYRLVK